MEARQISLVVRDQQLTRMVRRLVTAAGAVSGECSTEPELAQAWRHPAAVIVDVDGARRVLHLGLPRRANVVVVASGTNDVEVWQVAVAVGAVAVHVLPADEERLAEWVATVLQPAPSGRLLGVVGGRGGAGASTLAAAVALAGARAGPTLLVDADPAGGGVDVLLGIEQADGARWPAFTPGGGGLDPAGVLAALPVVAGLHVLATDPASAPTAAATRAVVAAALRQCHTVVADLPRSPSEAADVIAAAAHGVAVVVPAEVRAATAAVALVQRLRERCTDVRLVVRHPGPADVRVEDVARVVGAPVAATWRWDRRLAHATDTGGLARGWRRTSVAATARVLADWMREAGA